MPDKREANAGRKTHVPGSDDCYSHEITSKFSLCPCVSAILYDNARNHGSFTPEGIEGLLFLAKTEKCSSSLLTGRFFVHRFNFCGT